MVIQYDNGCLAIKMKQNLIKEFTQTDRMALNIILFRQNKLVVGRKPQDIILIVQNQRDGSSSLEQGTYVNFEFRPAFIACHPALSRFVIATVIVHFAIA